MNRRKFMQATGISMIVGTASVPANTERQSPIANHWRQEPPWIEKPEGPLFEELQRVADEHYPEFFLKILGHEDGLVYMSILWNGVIGRPNIFYEKIHGGNKKESMAENLVYLLKGMEENVRAEREKLEKKMGWDS